MRLRICKWSEYQHYKDRNPPWIKLHYAMLSSKTWVTLDDASRVLAIASMLIASKEDGEFDADPDYFKRVAYLNKTPDWKPLISKGFCEIIDGTLADASTKQATARPETEQSRGEERQSKPNRGAGFDAFWASYPKKVGKGAAEKAWGKLHPPVEQVLSALDWQRKQTSWVKDNGQFIPNPATYLNAKGWEDEPAALKQGDDGWEPTSEEAERLWPHLFGGTQV